MSDGSSRRCGSRTCCRSCQFAAQGRSEYYAENSVHDATVAEVAIPDGDADDIAATPDDDAADESDPSPPESPLPLLPTGV